MSKQPSLEQKRVFMRTIGVILWVSFVAAAAATMLFFATFDPLALIAAETYPIELERIAMYSIGFILFWVLTASSCIVTAWLISLPDEKLAQALPEQEGDQE